VAGLLVSVFQAMTQINEITLTFIPKILATVAALALFGPWMLTRLVSYTTTLFATYGVTDNLDLSLAIPFQQMNMAAMGVASESGEICEAVKHHIYHNHPLDKENLIKELGDMMWYVAAMATVIGEDLTSIANRNIQKLEARYPGRKFSSERSLNRDTSKE
jgi:NTP pyrophosphatase (non-canonical NTP hydrolase)